MASLSFLLAVAASTLPASSALRLALSPLRPVDQHPSFSSARSTSREVLTQQQQRQQFQQRQCAAIQARVGSLVQAEARTLYCKVKSICDEEEGCVADQHDWLASHLAAHAVRLERAHEELREWLATRVSLISWVAAHAWESITPPPLRDVLLLPCYNPPSCAGELTFYRAIEPLRPHLWRTIWKGALASPGRVSRLVVSTLLCAAASGVAGWRGGRWAGLLAARVRMALLPRILDDYAATLEAKLAEPARRSGGVTGRGSRWPLKRS
mmetsp:Transcript_34016/g.109232  ORF Transcript_34016/g.109232 Transcript_34016/m.109232 type:complete len:268 (+) Transcript_34016:42-845(+)